MRNTPHSLLLGSAVAAGCALAKLPPPTDEAKAKAAEAAAKTAHGNKVGRLPALQVDGQGRGAATRRRRQGGRQGRPSPPTDTPACADPGPFAAAGAPRPRRLLRHRPPPRRGGRRAEEDLSAVARRRRWRRPAGRQRGPLFVRLPRIP